MVSGILAVGAVLSALSGAGGSAASCRDGCYRLGIALDAASASGDLDGKRILSSDTFAVAVPELGTGRGLAAVAGIRAGELAFELRYERTLYTATLSGGDREDAVMQAFELDLKWFAGSLPPTRPFVKVGWVPFVQLDVDRAGATAAGIGAGHLRRLVNAWELGGGLEVPLGGWLYVELAAAWRLLTFDQVRGPHMSWASYSAGLTADGWHAQLGVTLEL